MLLLKVKNSCGFRNAILIVIVFLITVYEIDAYTVDDSPGVGRKFDGIGAISGGGATSKLLINYPEEYRNQILDFLFKPNFGASLKILKVEIGGDGQSSDGVEASHMHTEHDANYNRGYEWWLMKEAKKRNADIRLYGLPWSFPGWLADNGTNSPFLHPIRTITYIVNWIKGAKKYHDLDIDYIGIWNEREPDVEYVKLLRKLLDYRQLHDVQIVAGDLHWELAPTMLNDSTLSKAVQILGAHYPGTLTTKQALETNKPLWSSEDYSTVNDNTGAGCLARVVNQNYVNGNMTATIAWNLVTSYYDTLIWSNMGLMTANQPWSGYYTVSSPVWMTATARSLGNSLAFLQQWWIRLDWRGWQVVGYSKLDSVVNGSVTVFLDADVIMTLTTVTTGHHGSFQEPPASASFPLPYTDDFESYDVSAEPYNLAQQAGVWEVVLSNHLLHQHVIRQTITAPPLHWCDPAVAPPISIVGDPSWTDVSASVDVYIPLDGGTVAVFLAVRVSGRMGCDSGRALGAFFWVYPKDKTFLLTADVALVTVIAGGTLEMSYDEWHTIKVRVQGKEFLATVDGKTASRTNLPPNIQQGFVAIGTGNFGIAEYDNLQLTSP
ncbi:PREDICTED: galactocerebrosidase-like [Priapulus caudatus]|uniref:Galactocerebrosidase-like n=1 Tax=Priapulus caudatus TaxID=37621 RepID=A0ABM1E2F1_PRICU|nr:PREDICTED: galactocerebrosidase-like [Priapulus caudatus]